MRIIPRELENNLKSVLLSDFNFLSLSVLPSNNKPPSSILPLSFKFILYLYNSVINIPLHMNKQPILTMKFLPTGFS